MRLGVVAACLSLLVGCADDSAVPPPGSAMPTFSDDAGTSSARLLPGPARAADEPSGLSDAAVGSQDSETAQSQPPSEPTEITLTGMCALRCEAAGADSDGEPLLYYYELSRKPDGLFWSECAFTGTGAQAGFGNADCDRVLAWPCDFSVTGPDDSGVRVQRRVVFTLGATAVEIRGTKTAGGTTANWQDEIPYDQCDGTPPQVIEAQAGP